MKIGEHDIKEIIITGEDGTLIATITDDGAVAKQEIVVKFVINLVRRK